MKKQRITARVTDLVLNEGQIEWLPKNPRQWSQEDVDRTKASLERDADFQEDRPLLVLKHDDKFLVFAGNLRTTSAKDLKWETLEAVLYTPESEDDCVTIKRRAMLDNGSFGEWDFDALANEWDDQPLADWGLPSWINTSTGDFEEIEDLEIESVASAGESKSGFSAITFVFPKEEAEVVNDWIANNSKDELTVKIVDLCRNAEAK